VLENSTSSNYLLSIIVQNKKQTVRVRYQVQDNIVMIQNGGHSKVDIGRGKPATVVAFASYKKSGLLVEMCKGHPEAYFSH